MVKAANGENPINRWRGPEAAGAGEACASMMLTWVDDPAGWQPVTAAGFDPARAGDDRYAIYVWRSGRHGGDTKTGKSRRIPLETKDR